MKFSILQIVIVLLSTSLLYKIAIADPPSERVTDIDYNGSDCIWVRTIRDYTALDDRNLLIHGSGKRSYFVTLVTPSWEMKSSIGMGFATTDGQLCPYGRDRIVFRGLAQEEVRIRSISQVSADQAEQLLVRFGKSKAAVPQVPEPRPVQGAEIEVPD
jgi:hypothetical protein